LTVRNGLTLAYVVATINAGLGVLLAFGIVVSEAQQSALIVFVNAAMLLAARVLNLPEKIPGGGGTVSVNHLPVLTTRTSSGETTMVPPSTEGLPPETTIITSVKPGADV
jgi:hypothetical protein